VIEQGWVIKSLSNSDFNDFNLEGTQSYDFSEFRDSRLFYNDSIPIPRVIEHIKILNKYKNLEDRIIILTAREDMDDKYLYLEKFRESGISIDSMHIYRSGNLRCVGSVAFKKCLMIKKQLEQSAFDVVQFYDDSLNNLRAFLDLKYEYPNIAFEAFLVQENGSVQQY
jgi:hypothetical protein